MKPESVLLFGGSFNPPHFGHENLIGEALAQLAHINEVWLMPCNNHAFGKDLAPAIHRLAMLKLLIDDLPPAIKSKVKLCPIEIDFQGNGSTYDTLMLLRSRPEYLKKTMQLESLSLEDIKLIRFSFLIGSDQLPVFNKWQHWQELLQLMPFYVYPRPGYLMKPLQENMTPLKIPPDLVADISSTIIRERLQNGQDVDDNMIPATILSHIKANKLYESSPHPKP